MRSRNHVKIACLLLCVGSLILTFSRTSASGMTVVDDGRAAAVIVVADQANPTEIHAAEELSRYLQKATGASFDILPAAAAPQTGRILIGGSDVATSLLEADVVARLGAEDYIVRVSGNDVVLMGGSPRGTLYAVYSFLETEVGCRWLTWYGDEFVPSHRKLALPDDLDRRESPAFSVRDMLVSVPLRWVGGNSPEDVAPMRNFLVRNRGQGPELSLFEIGYGEFPGGLSMEDHGGLPHHYTSHVFFVHTLFQFVPPSEFFTSHPEYFSLVDGQRTAEQLCFANPTVRELLTDRVLARFGEAGGKGMISVSHEDNHIVCSCDECKAIDEQYEAHGSSIVAAIAQTAAAVAEKYPEARVSTLAYSSTKTPPENLELPSNLIVVFAPFHGIVESELEGWAGIAPNLWVWYYPNSYAGPFPKGTLNRIATDFRLFNEAGVDGFSPIEQTAPGVYDSLRLVDLQNWVLMKLMWDPHLDVEDLVTDFTSHFYGEAGPLMRQYAMALEEGESGESLAGSTIKRYQNLFDRAEHAVRGDRELLRRVKLARLGLDRATVLLWGAVSEAPGKQSEFNEVADRFRSNYELALARMPASQREMVRDRPEDAGAMLAPYLGVEFLDEYAAIWRAVEDKPKTGPQHPDRVHHARVQQILATEDSHVRHQRNNGWLEFVPDAAAAGGQTARFESPLFMMGYWDMDRSHGVRALTPSQITPGRYELYYLDRVLLRDGAFVYFDKSWRMQFHDIAKLIEPGNPGQWWDVWVSARFEGPAYDNAAAATEADRFFVDRIVLVKAQ